MALTEAQKRYQNSEKGKAARARYLAKKKAEKEAAKVTAQSQTPTEGVVNE